jgi:hypothetical protein
MKYFNLLTLYLITMHNLYTTHQNYSAPLNQYIQQLKSTYTHTQCNTEGQNITSLPLSKTFYKTKMCPFMAMVLTSYRARALKEATARSHIHLTNLEKYPTYSRPSYAHFTNAESALTTANANMRTESQNSESSPANRRHKSASISSKAIANLVIHANFFTFHLNATNTME